MITGLAHVCFRVADLETSAAFYRDRLGLAPAFDFINEAGERFGVYLHIGGRSFLELFQGAPEAPTGRQTYQHFCLETGDIRAAVEALRAAGVEVSDAKMGSDRSWQAWLKDPDGNRIELHQYTPDSKQAPHLR